MEIGRKKVAEIELSETVLENLNTKTKTVIKTRKTLMFMKTIDPAITKTPFPPLNLWNIGKICPSWTERAAIYSTQTNRLLFKDFLQIK